MGCKCRIRISDRENMQEQIRGAAVANMLVAACGVTRSNAGSGKQVDPWLLELQGQELVS